MSAFLLLLIKLNLAMAVGVIMVAVLRRPLRHWFGAPIAYAAWFLVPVAGIASLLPPRTVVPALARVAPVHLQPMPVPDLDIGHSALRVTEQLRGLSAPLPSAIGVAAYQMPEVALLLFAAWVLGTVLMALYLAGLQFRFSAAVQQGKAGPAVLGFFRPRIVTPAGFDKHFSPREQAAILAHEQVHLARQDARINALTALLRCLCWFNPFVHLGARWLRMDQELACDATVVAEKVSRSDYARALLKSQMLITALPLGCNWPGPQHPLIERIALLRRRPPSPARRFAGTSLVMLAAIFAGLGAWAAQPPAAAKPVAARETSITLVTPGAPSIAASAPAAAEPVISTNPTSNEAPMRVPATGALSPAPAIRPPARMVSIDAGMQSILAAVSPVVTAPLNIDTASEVGSVAAAESPVVPNTPSGATGDPNAVVCRAPQRIPGTAQFGPEACGHNYEWWKLAVNGKDLAPDGKTLIDRPTVKDPTGEGDPDAITCRTRKVVSHWTDRVTQYGPVVCRLNSFWADVIQNRQMVDARGSIVPRGQGRYTDYGPAYGPGGYPYNGMPGGGGYDSGQVHSGMPLPGTR